MQMDDIALPSAVIDALQPERAALVDLLRSLEPGAWQLPTECPAYDVKGVALHVLGDDLGVLSRQRDGAENGISQLASEMPDADRFTVLNTFNDRWVTTSKFLSTDLVVDLLCLTGKWTMSHYRAVDPYSLGEPVGLFGSPVEPAPAWQAIAREFIERWVHHSQIRRAVGMPSLADERLVSVGLAVIARVGGVQPGIPDRAEDDWSIGPVCLGPVQQTADILTCAHLSDDIRDLVSGPSELVELVAVALGRVRPTS